MNLLIGCLLLASGLQMLAQQNYSIRIDSHIHLYDTNREGSSSFLDPVKHKKIYYPHLAADFLQVAVPAAVNYAIVIEASTRREDNDWAMNIVNQSDNLLAFIANLDPRDENFIADLNKLSLNKKFRGIRIRPKSKIDISDEGFIETLAELAKRNLILELGPGQEPIEAIEKIARKYPEMNIIIDHMGGGRIQNGLILPENWNIRLKKLAALPNVYCKISELFDLAGQSPAPVNATYYKTYIDQVVDAFGPNRVLFGSNWTLSEMYGSYRDLVRVYDSYLKKNPKLTPEQLYSGNAIKAYCLNIIKPFNK